MSIFFFIGLIIGLSSGFFGSVSFLSNKYKAQQIEYTEQTDKKYELIVKEIRSKFKEAKIKLEADYEKALENINTACPNENIYFFDFPMIQDWYKQLKLYGYIYIPKNTFNDPMTHMPEQEAKEIDEMLKNF